MPPQLETPATCKTTLSRKGIFAWLSARGLRSYQKLRTNLPPSGGEIARVEQLVRGLRTSTGVFRTTRRGRFSSINAIVNEHLSECFDSSAELEVHDWATSDGLAAMEWATELLRVFPRMKAVASDAAFFLVEASRSRQIHYVVEPDGRAVQHIWSGLAVPLTREERWLRIVGKVICRWREADLMTLRHHVPQLNWDSKTESLINGAWKFRRISLLHPEVYLYMKNEERFSIRVHSVFATLKKPCHVIRTMNIFNRGYFEEPALRRGIRSVFDSLLSGGIWVVGRTEEKLNNRATIFQKTGSKFSVLERINSGSEIEHLVLPQY